MRQSLKTCALSLSFEGLGPIVALSPLFFSREERKAMETVRDLESWWAPAL